MGQNNETTERGDRQGQQNGQGSSANDAGKPQAGQQTPQQDAKAKLTRDQVLGSD